MDIKRSGMDTRFGGTEARQDEMDTRRNGMAAGRDGMNANRGAMPTGSGRAGARSIDSGMPARRSGADARRIDGGNAADDVSWPLPAENGSAPFSGNAAGGASWAEGAESGLASFSRNASAYAKSKGKSLEFVMTATLLAFIGVLMLLSLFAPDSDFSANENRSLSTWPEFSMENLSDGSFTKGLQSYVSDQFFLRDGWISLKLNEDTFRGVRESNGVYLCRDGYLMEKPENPDMGDVDRNLAAINAFALKYSNLNINYAIMPNAVCVMSDYLPDNAPVRDQRADLSMLYSKLADNVHTIDVTDDLVAHKDEGLYYRTDHHWTSRGAYYAFLAMANDLAIDNPITDYDIYTVSDSFEGTMASKCGSHSVKDTIETYTPQNSGVDYFVTYDDTHAKSRSMYKSEALKDKDQYTVFFGGNYPRVTIKTTNGNGRCLLMFKDSYANCFMQFLIPYYEKIIMIDPRYYYEDAGTIISNENVTDVLFLYNLNTYLGDTSLADVLNSAGTTSGNPADLGAEP